MALKAFRRKLLGFEGVSSFSSQTFLLKVSFSPAPECVIVVLLESTFSDARAAEIVIVVVLYIANCLFS